MPFKNFNKKFIPKSRNKKHADVYQMDGDYTSENNDQKRLAIDLSFPDDNCSLLSSYHSSHLFHTLG